MSETLAMRISHFKFAIQLNAQDHKHNTFPDTPNTLSFSDRFDVGCLSFSPSTRAGAYTAPKGMTK